MQMCIINGFLNISTIQSICSNSTSCDLIYFGTLLCFFNIPSTNNYRQTKKTCCLVTVFIHWSRNWSLNLRAGSKTTSRITFNLLCYVKDITVIRKKSLPNRSWLASKWGCMLWISFEDGGWRDIRRCVWRRQSIFVFHQTLLIWIIEYINWNKLLVCVLIN